MIDNDDSKNEIFSVPQTNSIDINASDASDGGAIDITDSASHDDGDQLGSSTSNEQNTSNIKWSKTLLTPTTLSSLLSPTTDHTSLKHNQHGLGLKSS